jgi:hypothetical protein
MTQLDQAINEAIDTQKPLNQSQIDDLMKKLGKHLNQKNEEGMNKLATMLAGIVSKSINAGSLESDKYGILTAEVKASAFKTNVFPNKLNMFNAELAKALLKIKNESTEPLAETEKAAILSDDKGITTVEPVKGEKITIDKENGKITLAVEGTKAVTKDITDFKKKTWREVAMGIIETICKNIKIAYETTVDFISKPFKALANRFKKANKAQPNTTQPDVTVSPY